MSTSTKLSSRVIFLILFITLSFSTLSFAQIKSPAKIQDHTSSIVVNGTAEGMNIIYTFNSSSKTSFAGIITGTLNTVSQKFYCIDLLHEVNPSTHPTYTDEGVTPAEMTYILNHYFPFVTSYTSKLSDNTQEAAAIQAAIWHFSDGVDANTITNTTIKARTLAIIADASANSGSTQP